jgi:diaminohydroxyphosphoribosylaminopyrimidine deaminase/5-amino-6-(5-phosphoribosylamino)uracil reductase
VDQIVLYLAPTLIGGHDAPGWLAGAGAPTLAKASQLDIVSVERLDRDLKVVADVHRDR